MYMHSICIYYTYTHLLLYTYNYTDMFFMIAHVRDQRKTGHTQENSKKHVEWCIGFHKQIRLKILGFPTANFDWFHFFISEYI